MASFFTTEADLGTPARLSLAPAVGGEDVAIRPEFSWGSVADATGYDFEITAETGAADPFAVIEHSASTGADSLTLGEDFEHDTTYNWRVRPMLSSGAGDWVTSYFTTTTGLGAPAQDSLAPVAGATLVDIELTFRWGAVPYAPGYEFVLAEETGAEDPFAVIVYTASTALNSHVALPSLEYDTTYNWRVRAGFAAGDGPWVSSFFTTEPDLSVLSRDSFVPAHGATDAPLPPTFSWDAVAGVTGYEIAISEDIGADDPFAIVEYTASPTENSHVVTGQQEFLEFKYGTSYYWRVRAINVLSGRGPWVTARFTIEPDPVPLGIPVTGPPSFGATGLGIRPTLGWAAVDRATGYEIELSEESSQGAPFAVIDYAAGTVSNFHVVGQDLEYDTTYTWRVRAVSASGPGPWSTSYFTTETDPTP